MGWFFFNSKKEASDDERRGSIRIPRVFIAQCECGNRRSFSMVFNISEGGLGVFLEDPVTVNTPLVLTIQHEFVNGTYNAEKINLSLPVKVAWIGSQNPKESPLNSEEKKFRAGCNFQALSPEIQKRFEDILLHPLNETDISPDRP